jgi:hypothetical protein
MTSGSITLADVAARTDTLAIACTRCDRAGKYPVANLITLVVLMHGPPLMVRDTERVAADLPSGWKATGLPLPQNLGAAALDESPSISCDGVAGCWPAACRGTSAAWPAAVRPAIGTEGHPATARSKHRFERQSLPRSSSERDGAGMG